MAFAPGWYRATVRFTSIDLNPPLLTTPVAELYRDGATGIAQFPLSTPSASGTDSEGRAYVEFEVEIELLSPGTWRLRGRSTTNADRVRRVAPTEIVIESDGFTD